MVFRALISLITLAFWPVYGVAQSVGSVEQTPDWTVWAVGGAVALLSISWFIVSWFRREVRLRTRKLQESEERFKDFAQASADWLWETGPDHRFTFTSNQYTIHSTLGLKQSDIVGRLRRSFAPEDIMNYPQKWATHEADLAAHRDIKNFKYCMNGPSNEVREVSVRGRPFYDAYGTFMGYRGVATDTTGQEQNIAALANAKGLLEQAERLAGIGHWTINVDTGELYWSDEIYRIYGLKPGSEIDTEAAINAYHPDDRKKVAEYVQHAIDLKEDYDFELRLIRTDGEVRNVRSIGVVRLKPNGDVASVFGIFHDITDTKTIQKELLEHRDHLEQLVTERTDEVEKKAKQLEVALFAEKKYSALQQEFIALVSHEFRTPLSIIDGTSQRLLRIKGEITSEDLADRVTKIRNAVKRMISLIDTTLYASRLDAGKVDFEPTHIDIKEILEAVCSNQAEISPSHDIQVDLDEAPATLYADAKLIEHVFTNLLSNAVKYSPSAPKIEVKGWASGTWVTFTITDHGIGIPEEDLPFMFERFFRAGNAKGINGSGIGLSICKGFVKMHGGTITADSAKGQGTIFTVRLPNDNVGS